MPRLIVHHGASILAALVAVVGGSAAEVEADGVRFFETKIRPVLARHCYKCHSADAKKVRGGLRLDSRAAMRRGGESGPAVVPSKVDRSWLIDALRRETFEMPPDEELPAAVIADFVKWIEMGAPDPRGGDAARPPSPIDLEVGRKFWSFQPPRKWPAPEVQNVDWPFGDIDRYVLARLEAAGLSPAGDADRRTLIRRVYFDLIGMPPSPEQVQAFLDDRSPEAHDNVIDQLLASEYFGERWGRHWLDVVRYADSSGGGRTRVFEDAWRYRDYVIRAFSDDMPYDQFLAEQVAGDLLPFDTPGKRRRQLTATGFLVLGPTNYELQDKPLLRMEVVDEQIDVIGRAMLGMTIGCARCHNHKFDPIPTTDYYALAGIFRSTKTLIHANVSDFVERSLPRDEAQQEVIEQHRRAVQELEAKLELAQAGSNGPTAPAAAEVRLGQLKADLKALKSRTPAVAKVMSVEEEQQPADYHVCIGGDIRRAGPKVPRGFLSVATTGGPPEIAPGQSGRRELAQWLGSPDNPLTARVMANRIWHHLFGSGLVRTTDNFGTMGEAPSHPRLLDYLAVELVDSGWSIKTTIRQIMRSRSYQMSGAHNASAAKVDPENRLLWHKSRRRLDAEALRDAILAVSGRLDLTVGGTAMRPGTKSEFDYPFSSVRRSVYVPVFRNTLHGLFAVFDVADPNLVSGHRTTSTLPTQALYMMNSPLVMDQAQHAAESLLAVANLVEATRVELAFERFLGRPPSDAERQLTRRYLKDFDGTGEADPAERRLLAWTGVCQSLLACVDFRYVR